MKIIRIDPVRINQLLIKKAAAIVKKGGVVIFPTDTVYGIGCQADNLKSIKGIYRIKKRDSRKPLPVLIAAQRQLPDLQVVITREAKKLMAKFWPGPLTLVLPTNHGKTIGVRMPEHKVALELLKKTGPLAVTSVNFSREASARTVAEIPADIINSVDLILDSGNSPLSVESTVVDMTGRRMKILRAGCISRQEIAKAVKDV
ncbi:MAG: threonylcarbamoyl-AMP synthase [Elusimicrobia bacterium]|nr:threonylcarbamoyl-AMP synthase [Elusimicrobiota bacterium]